MANALRDDNRKPGFIGKDENGVLQLGTIDGVTGRLLVALQDVASFPDPASTSLTRDANRKPVAFGKNSSDQLRPILIDNASRGVVATVTIE